MATQRPKSSAEFVNGLAVLVGRLEDLEGRVETLKNEPTVDLLLERMEVTEQKLREVRVASSF